MHHVRVSAVAAGALALAASCLSCHGQAASSGGAARIGLLDAIPADTPYVFASVDPMPAALIERLASRFAPFMTAMQEMAGKMPGADAKQRQLFALSTEMMRLMTPEGSRVAGLPRDFQFAIHGDGVWPVWRIVLADPAAFEAFAVRTLDRLKLPYTAGEIAGRRVRYIRLDARWTVTLTVDRGQMVAALLPAGASLDRTRRALGFDPPARSQAASGALRRIAAERRWLGYGVGYADTAAIASALSDELSADPACRAEIVALAGAMPRVLVGYDRLTDREIGIQMAFELRRDLAGELAGVQTETSLGAPDGRALFDVSAAADLTRAIAFLRRRGQAIAAAPYRCAWLQALNKASSLASLTAPPFIEGVRGVRVALEEIAPPSDNVEAWLVLRGREPLVIARALAALSGADLSQLRDGGPAVPFELAAFLPKGSIAAKGDGLAISVGRRTTGRTASLLDFGPGRRAPLLRVAYDYGRLMAAVSKAIPAAQGGGIGAAFAGFGRVLYEITIEPRGLLMRTSMEVGAGSSRAAGSAPSAVQVER